MYEIPTSVIVNGVEYPIRNNGDFRVILDCFQALGDVELTATERLLAALIIFYEDFDSTQSVMMNENNLQDLVSEMYKFFNCGSELTNSHSSHKLIDWDMDSQLICSAINKVAGKEIRTESYIHWWTFMGYYSAIDESPISTIIRIRDKISSGKKLEKYEREYRTANPQYFNWNSKTVEESEAEKLVRELWNSGG